MAAWRAQVAEVIAPAVARSDAVREVAIDHGALASVGAVAGRHAVARRVLIVADRAGFAAAGAPVAASLRAAGFAVRRVVLPADPPPRMAVEAAVPIRAALVADPELLPIAVGSGAINDLVKYAAHEEGRRYICVATAASMEGYVSAGARLNRGGGRDPGQGIDHRGGVMTLPARGPVAMIADLDVLAAAPVAMTGWGYAELAGKSPAGGDWLLADLVGAESLDGAAYPMVQDNLRGWLTEPGDVLQGRRDSVARLFVGLTVTGFAAEIYGSSRPISGADHQIAHIWEMAALTHQGRRVSHGAAVGVASLVVLALYDWLLDQDLGRLDRGAVLARSPDLDRRRAALEAVITDPHLADRAEAELIAKHVPPQVHSDRLARMSEGWEIARQRLSRQLFRYGDMAEMLRRAGAPSSPAEIGLGADALLRSLRAAPFLRRRYTIFDFLHETGLWEAALASVLPQLAHR